MIWSSCSKTDKATQLEIKRLQARNEVQNVMGRYAFYHTSGMNFLAAERLFTTYDDTVIEMMWGRFTGKDAAYRCYTVAHRNDDLPTINTLKLDAPELTVKEQALVSADAAPPADSAPVSAPAAGAPDGATGGTPAGATGSAPDVATGGAPADSAAASGDTVGANPDTMQTPEGFTKNGGAAMRVNTLTTPVIEVAGDGETARAVWFCPGLEGATPTWIKYGCDFKKQDGEWKIWHLHVYGMLMGLEAKESFTPNTTANKGADKPPTTNWEYSKAATYIPYEPAPPQPYDTWDYNKISPKSYGDPN